MKLFVGNLSFEITSEDLMKFFSQIGGVVSARVISDAATGRSRGFGFVEMSDRAGAERAIQEFHGIEVLGRVLMVDLAKPVVRQNV